ncbi:protein STRICTOSIDINE SYNTHASE-LIKE 10-like [Senna tora]|uniref:Protein STRICTOSIDINE SYNTHASE-LIKE 10-like n=1 Tax=Senna tora TaxID=362788 RepID=A0A834WLP1_9FABA|nr:protein STRICTOSIDINE SYNTHASE-LIKE 10-like [Senna tora]
MKPLSSPTLVIILLVSLLLLSIPNNVTTLSGEVAAAAAASDEVITLPQVSGPESLAFDCNGEGPYVGVSDGRILKWRGNGEGWVEFAVTSHQRLGAVQHWTGEREKSVQLCVSLSCLVWDRKLCDWSTDQKKEATCGRPLGLKFDPKTCNLYIADAYFGLLMVGPNGGVAQQLATCANDGAPFQFLNALDIDHQTGVIYFTDSSTLFQRWEYQVIVLTGDKTGRLLKYDPKSKKAQVLLKGLAFPNGVALSQDASFLLLAESTFHIIHKVWLRGSRAYTYQLFALLERSPDNIKRNQNGDFWVALNSYRATLRSAAKNQTEIPWRKEDPVGVKFDEKGEIMEVLDGRGGQELESVSEVEEHDGRLWIGSIDKSYVAIVNL